MRGGDFVFFFKQKTAYEMRISDWSSDVCSSDLLGEHVARDDDSPTGLGVAAQDRAHRRDLRWVEAVRRLVEDEQLREPEHGLGDAENVRATCRERVGKDV